MHVLDFEKSVSDLETKIEELRHLSDGGHVNIGAEISRLQEKVDKQLRTLYEKLTPAQKVQVARHPERPHCLDYIKALIEDFTPLSGDRLFGDDQAIIGGLGRFRGESCVIIGQERGFDTESRIKHNFGMAKPEGYRKAQRLMRLAERFSLPIITLVDTAGAFPGVEAEARGQAEAIARSIETCLGVKVPLVSCIIGEGGSGGAIALAAANRVLMLEHAIYSVISPEGCASILWRSASHADEAAAALKLTAQDLLQLGIIDSIVSEPVGGAHRDPQKTIKAVGDALEQSLEDLVGLDGPALVSERRKKFLDMGKKGLA
ncbi:MAG: acetyl-CoA carboxylase carboxyltransferase subunit alpha [Alphaproteobacteria bacterium]|nr:acetyl-CoA carboxylase carboxyltransferase subunit alpha [Alphaproteobacteria bacterium]